MRLHSFLRTVLFAGTSFLALAGAARATWSIVVVDRSTGEVCVAGATCLSNLDLRQTLTVILVGKGGGAAQSAIDSSGQNRLRMWNGLMAGLSPQEILDELLANDSSAESRQYGIVNFDDRPVGFSGRFAGYAKAEVFCEVGDLAYAIQGNVLAGPAVCWRAEEALLTTDGDLSQRVIAAMEAARAYGGDGRCSCNQNKPDLCGSPPPDFDKSAHIAFMVLARLGDQDGVCSGSTGCANGNYYLALDVIAGVQAPDPVLVLEDLYADWRASKGGLTDQQRTRVVQSAERLVADGTTAADVRVELRDLDGLPLGHGGQTVELVYTGDLPQVAFPGPVTDNGDGTHTFRLTAGQLDGRASFRILVHEGLDVIQLHPELVVDVDPLVDLHAGYRCASIAEDVVVPFVLNRGAAEAGRGYQILGSASGSEPGTPWMGLTIPLNADRLFLYTMKTPGLPVFRQSLGSLDADGRGEAWLDLPYAAQVAYLGRHLDFCALLFGKQPGLTELAGFDVVP